MSSINLLPKDVKIKRRSPESSGNAILFVSFLLIFASISLPVGIYFNNKILIKKVDDLDKKLADKDKILQDEFSKNKTLSLEKTIDDANLLLADHKYYTKVIEILQDDFIENVFIESFSIKKEKNMILLNFSGYAKTDFDVAKQINFLRRKDYIIDVFVNSVSVDKNDFVKFSGDIYVKKEVASY